MAKKTERPSVINMSYKAARDIMHYYNENNESYLRSMVRKHVPDAENVLACADKENLIHHTRTIKGIAKIVNNKDKKILEENGDILDRIGFLSQLTDSVERFLVDERVCLQLEGRKIPQGCLLSNAYIGAKNLLS